MTPEDFQKLATLLKSQSGLVLGQDKAYLAESRLTPVARTWGFADAKALIRALVRREGKGGDPKLLLEVVEAMTTNESFFFRDQRPFDQLRDVILPSLLASRASNKRLRIWSAACSSGQEPYSIAMILNDMQYKLRDWRIEIVATDLSRPILHRATEGRYTQFEVQRGLPITLLAKYFTQDGEQWRISDQLKRMVTFRVHNLLDGPASLGKFDIVFCRNVLIYFDQATKGKVLDGIAANLAEDGFLTLGGAETVLGVTDRFKMVDGQRGLYARTDGTATALKGPTGQAGQAGRVGAA
jgi:chemotaxis protein methyltransferase CheR